MSGGGEGSSGFERVSGAKALDAGALPSWPQLRSDRASRSASRHPLAGHSQPHTSVGHVFTYFRYSGACSNNQP